MRKYETIFIIDSLLKADEIDNIINKYERFISANGGQIEAVERWGKKRLSYEIKKRQYGYYVLIRFNGPPIMIKTLEREYRLNESMLRYKTLLLPNTAFLLDKKNDQNAVTKVTASDTAEEILAETTDDPKKNNDDVDDVAGESNEQANVVFSANEEPEKTE